VSGGVECLLTLCVVFDVLLVFLYGFLIGELAICCRFWCFGLRLACLFWSCCRGVFFVLLCLLSVTTL